MSSKDTNINTQARTRRQFLQKMYNTCGIALAGTFALIGCGKSDQQSAEGSGSRARQHDPADPCGDLTDVNEKDIAVREKLGYVKESPLPDNECQNCNLYLPPKEGQSCGGCMLFKGPVYASAYCTYWAPKV